jgi:O-antigen ligase
MFLKMQNDIEMELRELRKSGNLSFYCCIICMALLSLHIHWLPPFMIAWVIIWYFEQKGNFSWSILKNRKETYLFFFFVSLFIWQAAGLLYADSFDSGIERIIKRVAFILFPAVLFFPGEKIKRNIGFILKLYSIFIFIYLIYSFINSFINSFHFEEGRWVFRTYHELYTYESYFTGERLSGIVHPTYLSMYVLIAMIITLDIYFNRESRRRMIWLSISILFFAVILLLSSRAGIIAALIILPIFLYSKLFAKIPLWLMVSIIGAFIAVFAFSVFTNTRLKSTVEDISKENINEILNKDVRLLIWRSAFGVIKHNPIIGSGTGDASDELKKEFTGRGYTEGYYNDLNAHNQFLEIFLENGLIGLILFIGLIWYILHIANYHQNYLLQFFLVITIIFFFFESMLNRLSGVMFFPLMTFLLVNLNQSKYDQ